MEVLRSINFQLKQTIVGKINKNALKLMCLGIVSALCVDLTHKHNETNENAFKNFKWFVYRYGRVNYVLAKRLDLLTEVQRLQESLEVTGDVAYTCETAGHFFLYQVLARWEIFLATVRPANKKVCFSLKK